ncbi:hypothetical protein Sjap_018873 [Stephania japonica]|uniref:inorganic diphosphatase n=1 Tax=Stephania japonica TaxID=461633 RepID=A0AAP0NL15_9MAGN
MASARAITGGAAAATAINRFNRPLTSTFLTKLSFSASPLKNNKPLNARPSPLLHNRSLVSTTRALYKSGGADVKTKEEGLPETLDYRVFFLDTSGKKVSPWHDIPLHLGDGVFNFVVEIPKESSAKMEVATDEPYTPIKQDTKKGKLRYYPYNINWNYGLLPQTWEDPSLANDEVEGAFGDNDPVDVVEIGEVQRKIGEVIKVKPLAALAMIDEGELDWKIVAISVDDHKASLVNDIEDVEKHFPGTLTAIRDWFRDYKIPDGKPPNKFGLGNKAANKVEEAALEDDVQPAEDGGDLMFDFEEPPKFDEDGRDFVEDKIVFGDNGIVVKVIQCSTTPQVCKAMPGEVVIDNSSIEVIAQMEAKFSTKHFSLLNEYNKGVDDFLQYSLEIMLPSATVEVLKSLTQ